MKQSQSIKRFLWLGLLVPGMAFAHPGHGSGVLAGLAHPFTGLDHLLTMLAVGMWTAVSVSSKRHWVPAGFVAGLLLGALAGIYLPAPGMSAVSESMIAASMLAMPLLLASLLRLPVGSMGAVAAFVALWHGYAHGAEMPAGSQPLSFMLGMVAASVLLLAAGYGVGRLASSRLRWLGAAMALISAIWLAA